MKVEISPGMIRLAEQMTTNRAAEHVASIVMAMNGAAEFAEMLTQDERLSEHAAARAGIYARTRAKFEQAFSDMTEELTAASEKAHASTPEPAPTAKCTVSDAHRPQQAGEGCTGCDELDRQ